MISRLTVVVVAMAGICCAMPAGAEEVGVGPVGVTVGPDHRDRDRDLVRDRDHRDGDKTIIIKKDHDRDRDNDQRTVDHH
jgi:hypothetical protein